MATRTSPGPGVRYEAGRTSKDAGAPDDRTYSDANERDSSQRQPKGDHHRRLALFLEPDAFAAEAGITTDELREYERTNPDGKFDVGVAERVGEALRRLEAAAPAGCKIIS